MEGSLRVEVEGPVAILTLERPEKLNALTVPMLDALEAAADRIDRDREVRIAILTGAGTKAFCCGADIVAWGGLEPLDMWRHWVRAGHRVFDLHQHPLIERFKTPEPISSSTSLRREYARELTLDDVRHIMQS